MTKIRRAGFRPRIGFTNPTRSSWLDCVLVVMPVIASRTYAPATSRACNVFLFSSRYSPSVIFLLRCLLLDIGPWLLMLQGRCSLGVESLLVRSLGGVRSINEGRDARLVIGPVFLIRRRRRCHGWSWGFEGLEIIPCRYSGGC